MKTAKRITAAVLAIAMAASFTACGNKGQKETALDFTVESFFDSSAEKYIPLGDDDELDDYKIDKIVESCPEFEENGLFEESDYGTIGYMYLGECSAIFDGRVKLSETAPVYCSISTLYGTVMFINFYVGSIDYAKEQASADLPDDFGESEPFEFEDFDKCYEKMADSMKDALGTPESEESDEIDWETSDGDGMVSIYNNDDGISIVFSMSLF